MPGFHPDTKGTVEDTFFFFFKAHLFSRAVDREGGMLQTNNTGMCSQSSATLGLPPFTAHVASLPTLLRL